ncbi:F-box protein At2g32560-like [Cucurbita maxima]|uniref:F-box protein At2g32560-like n=1 Tax=Cucurbita maxima TaxID=3661 RepID=A0A6J1K130_CUCMA|nr:F-box protein At2g32560-like [Cucurbita maxima]XP_022995102.1 F-box protein At2g32560-like [Cucurbita maxima]
MLLCFFLTCLSFLLFIKSLPLKPLPLWAYEMRLLPHWFWKELSFFPIYKVIKNSLCTYLFSIPSRMSLKKKYLSKIENVEENSEMSVLDLPELVLEGILERLPPGALCSMAGVCSSLRERCISDRLWEKHIQRKWGKVIGQAAYREWQWYLASRAGASNLKQNKQKSIIRLLSFGWSLSWIRSKANDNNTQRNSLPVDSIMSWYLALETGRFWFPAQVYNRENGHVGFMLSCYDAKLCYDPHTDTFQARYPPHGRRAIAIENGVQWERLRAPPIDTPPHDLHISDCLNELCPGDHIEIQWRKNKEFPYGWWYGVVGHLETCDGNATHCRCHYSETVVLEFNQYTPGSRWRLAAINRKDHREEGNEIDGFYGGIRKLCSDQEISMWKQLWPTDILE